jgi:hypothetical protein
VSPPPPSLPPLLPPLMSHSGNHVSDVTIGEINCGGERVEDARGDEDHGLARLGSPGGLVHHSLHLVLLDCN